MLRRVPLISFSVRVWILVSDRSCSCSGYNPWAVGWLVFMSILGVLSRDILGPCHRFCFAEGPQQEQLESWR
ncbi:hypothetical protein PAHAL_1G319000 [Panicum hallii]|uniref:Uncharacterized protein n=1 Tax=Panicum hallii TaxID=206008 RepID=A0A2S3GRR7_9POAL|nr:hypothetical protein PAHAL_1G319000 [Panicum hallii]